MGRSGSPATTGAAMVALGVTLFGVNGSLVRVLSDAGMGTRYVAGARMTGLAVLLLAVAWRTSRADLRLGARDAVRYATFGLIGIAAMQWVYSEALTRLDIGLALVVIYIAPFLVAFWCRVRRGQRQSGLVWLAMGIAFCGLALAIDAPGTSAASVSALGLLAAATGACIYAYYALELERLGSERSVAAVLGLAACAGALVWDVAVAPIWDFPTDTLTRSLPLGGALHGSVSGWLLLAIMVVPGTVVPYGLFMAGLGRVGPAQATVTAMVEPIAAALVAWLWLGQHLTPLQVAGGAVVLGAVLAAQLLRPQAL